MRQEAVLNSKYRQCCIFLALRLRKYRHLSITGVPARNGFSSNGVVRLHEGQMWKCRRASSEISARERVVVRRLNMSRDILPLSMVNESESS